MTHDNAVEDELVDQLRELGLSEYEAHTLVALVRLGTGTAKDVAEVDKVPRTRVYDTAKTLHELGLVDIEYTTPRRFSVASRESIVGTLDAERERRIADVAELFEQLEPVRTGEDRQNVWTVTGKNAIDSRLAEFVEGAERRLLYMSVDEPPTDDQLDRLQAAAERGVNVGVAGLPERDRRHLREAAPSVELVETCWEWADTPVGRLLVADDETALVSVRTGDGEETAIWGDGVSNTLVVVLRAVLTPRLGTAVTAGD